MVSTEDAPIRFWRDWNHSSDTDRIIPVWSQCWTVGTSPGFAVHYHLYDVCACLLRFWRDDLTLWFWCNVPLSHIASNCLFFALHEPRQVLSLSLNASPHGWHHHQQRIWIDSYRNVHYRQNAFPSTSMHPAFWCSLKVSSPLCVINCTTGCSYICKPHTGF